MSTKPTYQIGEFIPAEGGYFGGAISAFGMTLGVIWAPKDHGETKSAWHAGRKSVPGADSCFNSVANTIAMDDAGSDLAKWAQGLDINGHRDWVIPARDVLELGCRHFKPTDEETCCSFRDGDNPSSVPPGYPYTGAKPIVQTSVLAFQGGGEQAFEPDWYWSSTQYSDLYAWGQDFSNGYQCYGSKSYEGRARAVRLIQLNP